MKLYIISLAAGILVGVIYALINVRSPAPPIVALIGLLGILIGEQAVPIIKKLIQKEEVTYNWVKKSCNAHMFAQLPGHKTESNPPKDDRSSS